MDEKYLQWHTGLRFERGEGRYRPFVESNDDRRERLFSTKLFEDRGDAAVEASNMLEALREGRGYSILHSHELGSEDADHELLV